LRRPDKDSETNLNRAIQRVLLGTVIVACLVLFVLWRIDNPRLERARLALADLLVPSMSAVTEPLTLVAEAARDYENFLDVYAQNEALRREIQRLRAWRETARHLEEENAQLRALNNVKLAPRTTFVTGDVIADSGGPFLQSILVNVGAADGVADGAAAVDGAGVVGRVFGLGRRAARILLLSDFSSRIPVVVEPDGRRAVLSGDGRAAPALEFLDPNHRVEPGDPVITSGDGGVFPPDLPVGRVIAAADGQLRVALHSDLSRLEFVRLLSFRPDTSIDRPGGLMLPEAARPDFGAAAQAGE